jgi:tetratricopeptide (TPR) repeat protein
LLACVLATALAQSPGDLLNGQGSLRDRIATAGSDATAPGTGIVTLSVFAEREGAHLDRQALLKLVNRASQNATWATTDNNALGVFTNIAYGNYDVEVSAVGYLSTQKELQVAPTMVQLQLDVVLHRDPAAVNLDVADTLLSPKARKEARYAVSDLKSGKLNDAQKQLEAAYQSAPSSPDLNFLLGYLYFQKKDFAQAGTYLGTATTLNPHNTQALTLLGRTGLERKDYPAARSALEQAVLADAENWLPHNLLADTYLHQKNYDKARDEAQVAISKGKDAASPAQLVLGQALINLGNNEEGVQALNVFLTESPKHPMAGQVRELIAEIQGQDSTAAPGDNTLEAKVRFSGVDPLLALPPPRLSVKSWQPPGIDDL